MNQVQIQIPLDLPEFRVEKVEQTPKGLVITVVSSCQTAVCRQCGRTIDKFFGYDKALTLRHLPLFDLPVWIRIKPKRYQCPYCPKGPTTTQRCQWYEPKSPHTKAYEHWILRELVNSTLSDVSLKRGLSIGFIEGIIDRHVRQQVDWPAVPDLELNRNCADKARKAAMKRLKSTLPAQDYAHLKGAMWAFRKPWAALTEE